LESPSECGINHRVNYFYVEILLIKGFFKRGLTGIKNQIFLTVLGLIK
jgi:hypothetical protein